MSRRKIFPEHLCVAWRSDILVPLKEKKMYQVTRGNAIRSVVVGFLRNECPEGENYFYGTMKHIAWTCPVPEIHRQLIIIIIKII